MPFVTSAAGWLIILAVVITVVFVIGAASYLLIGDGADHPGGCGLCGSPLRIGVGFADANRLHHDERSDCYHRWTVYGARPGKPGPARPVGAEKEAPPFTRPPLVVPALVREYAGRRRRKHIPLAVRYRAFYLRHARLRRFLPSHGVYVKTGGGR